MNAHNCDHRWTRDDALTMQCIRCGAYGSVRKARGEDDG